MVVPIFGPWLSFVVGCLMVMATGATFVVPVYMNAIKEKFGYKQWIVELIPALCYFGFAFLIPVGVFNERFGLRWTIFSGLLLTVTGYMALWSSTIYVDFFSSAGGLQSLFHFLIGFGYGFYKLAALTTSADNFQPKHRAKALAVLATMFSVGTILISSLYGIAFVNGHKKDEGRQDLRGYYLCNAVVNLLVGILCLFFLRPFPVDSEHTCLVDADSSPQETDNAGENDITGCTLFKSLDFQFFLWGSVLSGCVQLVYLNNVGTFLKSFDMEEYTTYYVITTSVSQIIAKMITGAVSDLLIDKFPRTTVLLILTIFQSIFVFLSIFFSDKFVMLLLTTIAIAMADGCLWCTSWVIMREYYGRKYYGRNFGFFTTVIATCVIGSQLILGWMYQQIIPNSDQINCYGKECFTWTFVIESIFSFISVVLFIGVYYNHRNDKNRY